MRRWNVARSVSHSQVFEYILERIRAAYQYFAIPQITSGPLFSDVSGLKSYLRQRRKRQEDVVKMETNVESCVGVDLTVEDGVCANDTEHKDGVCANDTEHKDGVCANDTEHKDGVCANDTEHKDSDYESQLDVFAREIVQQAVRMGVVKAKLTQLDSSSRIGELNGVDESCTHSNVSIISHSSVVEDKVDDKYEVGKDVSDSDSGSSDESRSPESYDSKTSSHRQSPSQIILEDLAFRFDAETLSDAKVSHTMLHIRILNMLD